MAVSPAPTSDITVTLGHTAGTATASTGSTCEAGADYVPPASVVVTAGQTTSSLITIRPCFDRVVESDEQYTLTIASGTGYTVGTLSSTTVTIRDGTFTVSLAASPNPVAEGSTVTVTATRSGQGPAASIPLTLTAGTAEPGDFGTLTSISMAAGATSGTGTVTTNADSDTADETFTVALNTASLPTGHAAGSTTSVTVTVVDTTINLSVVPGNARLDLSWTALSARVTGYDVHYTSATTGSVANNAAAAGNNPASAWVAVSRSGTTASQAIASLSNGTTYRVRVRATGSGNIAGAWVFGSGTPAAPSSNANLSGLAASTSTSAGGAFSALNIGSFAASTTSYTATVANTRTHAKLTPTAAHSAASITVEGTTVASGSASGAIALNEGANALTVQVTAQDGTTKDYTITITRQQSSNANLSGLTASTSTSASGTFSALNIGNFAASTTSYAATVANTRTHAKLTPTAAHSAASVTVQGTTVASGSASGAIALSEGTNALTVQVTAQDGTTRNYTVTITRQTVAAPPAVSLSASPNPVPEGTPVTVTATLSAALQSGVTIPLTLTRNSSEAADHDTLASIAISAGSTSGTGTIATNQDSDTADETFTVALGSSLPSSVTAGSPASVQVTINDDDEPPVGEPPVGGPTGDTPVRGFPRKPRPLQLALWTDKPGYRAGETVRLYYTVHPHDDGGQYRVFAWLEPAAGEGRRYLAPLAADGALHTRAVDMRGLPEASAPARSLPRAEKALAFEGEAPAPGRWRFVLELRPGSADEQYEEPAESLRTRRAWAAFTVAERSLLLNRRGFDREIRTDATLRSDTLYYLGHQLFVRDGATLTIEAGTVVLASGSNTAIIVEPGARIVAEGTRQAPVVLTCSSFVGQRRPGCWGGLRILGKAPVTRQQGVAPGVLPAARRVYGGTEADGFSGLLRYVRVEFAGAADEAQAPAPAIGLYGAGGATLLDHVQARHSLGAGFAFSGGSARCDHCVVSGSRSTGLSWERGWRGSAAHLYVQHGNTGLDGLAGGNDDQNHDAEPRSLPTLSNVTLVHTFPYGRRERKAVALRLSTGSGVRVRDLLTTRFLAGAIDARGRSALLFHDGESSVSGALLDGSGPRTLRGGIANDIEFIGYRDPKLRDVRDFANPDPRPKPDSPALHDEGEGYIGAFGRKENWLEEWTVFGPESAYDPREGDDAGN